MENLDYQRTSEKMGKSFNVSLINAANLNIPDRATRKDTRRDFPRFSAWLL